MTLLDLSGVTNALIVLLEESFKTSPAWAPANTTPTILPLPPDLLPKDALGLHLYHVREDGHYKNAPPPGRDMPPVRYTPMALELFYQLSASFKEVADAPGGYRAQRMMGLAVKALHDWPVVNDGTLVGTKFPLAEGGIDRAGNVVRICLQPMAHDDAMGYWTAGATPLRLAAYYEVSVVQLEPESVRSRVGRVLRYGTQIFTAGAAHLDGSRSTMTFRYPGDTTDRTIEVRPAQAAVGDTVFFEGSGLEGDQLELRLRMLHWTGPVNVASEWGVSGSANRLTARVQAFAGGEDVVPGMCTAAARVVSRRTMPDGSVRDFARVSNDTPFVIAPGITTITDLTAGIWEIAGGPFQNAAIAADGVLVLLDGTALTLVSAVPDPGPGEFIIDDPATLRLQLPAGTAPGTVMSLRIFVNGAESPPRWIVAT